MPPVILESTLRKLVETGAGLKVGRCLPGNSDAPRPSGVYATLLESDDLPRAHAENSERGGLRSSAMNMRATYSLQFYRGADGDPSEAARRFRLWAHSATGLEAVEIAGAEIGVPFVFDQPFGARRLDIPAGDSMEHRSVIDLVVDYVDGVTETVPTIDGVSATITRSSPGGDIVETVTT